MDKLFPFDLSGVRAYGTDRWLDEGRPNIFCGEYQRIYKLVFSSYLDAFSVKDSDEHVYYAGLVNYKNIPYISQYIYNCLCLEKLKGKMHETSGGSKLEAIDDKISRIRGAICFDKAEFSLGFKDYWKEQCRTVRSNWGFFGPIDALFPGKCACKYLIAGDRNQKEVRKFIEENGTEPVSVRPVLHELFDPLNTVRDEHQANMEIKTGVFFNSLRRLIPEASGLLDDKFEQSFLANYLKTIAALHATLHKISSWHRGELLVTPVGNIYNRIMASAWRILGGHVTGFSHGNIYPYAYNPGDIINGALEVLDRFMVASNGEKRLLEDARRDYREGYHGDFEISTYKSSIYKPIFDSLRGGGRGEIRKIALIGHPMDYFNSSYLNFMNTMSLLHLELRVIRDLKAAGYYLIYKIHPDTESEAAGIFEGRADEISRGRFEDSYRNCDCVLFTKPFSTTFGFTLMTDLPVVLMDHPHIRWHREVRPLLEKRCALVKADTEASTGTIKYSCGDLTGAVKASPELLNYEIVEKFAF